MFVPTRYGSGYNLELRQDSLHKKLPDLCVALSPLGIMVLGSLDWSCISRPTNEINILVIGMVDALLKHECLNCL